MRIAFIVKRTTYYRLFCSLADAALAGGHEVVFMLDTTPVRGAKAYQRPDLDSVPDLRNGTPIVATYQGAAELASQTRHYAPQVSVFVNGIAVEEIEAAKAPGGRAVVLPHGFDMFSCTPQEAFAYDAAAVNTQQWKDLFARVFTDAQTEPYRLPGEGHATFLDRHFQVTGWPELDQFALVDPEEVRRRYGILDGRPVVLVVGYAMPVPFPWDYCVFSAPSRGHGLWRAVRTGNLALIPQILDMPGYNRVLLAIRDFCDRAGAYLIIKARPKDNPSPLGQEIADLQTFDTSFYPHSIVELASIADLCINFQSMAVLEAIYGHTPCLTFMPSHALSRVQLAFPKLAFEAGVFNGPEAMYEFPGVCYQHPVEEALTILEERMLADFPLDAIQRKRYLERWVSPNDASHSERTLALIEQLVAERVALARP